MRAPADCGAQGWAHRAKQGRKDITEFRRGVKKINTRTARFIFPFSCGKLAGLGANVRRWLVPVSRGAFYSVAKEFHLV